MAEHLVFAYGSNLNSADFARYCREKGIDPFVPQKVCNAQLKEYTISWNVYSKARKGGALNLEKKTKEKQKLVCGTIFSLSDEQLAVFDRKEGHPKHYLRTEVTAICDEKEMQVETYIAPQCIETRFFYSTENYRAVVIDGLIEQNISQEYIDYFKEITPVIDFKPFDGICTRKTAIYSGFGVAGRTICYWQNLYANNDLGSLDILYSHLFSQGKLSEYDLLIIPGGDNKEICAGLGDRSKCDIRSFIDNGGLLLAVCAGAYLVTHHQHIHLAVSPLVITDFEHAHRGEAMLKLNFTDRGKQLFGVHGNEPIPILYHNGPTVMKSDFMNCFDFQVLATFAEELLLPESQPNVMIGSPAAWMNKYGKGTVTAISPHIERTEGQRHLMANLIKNIFNL